MTVLLPQSWTAEDIEQGDLTIRPEEGRLRVERIYWLVDGEGQPLPFGRKTVRVSVAIAAIPASVLSALQTINQFTRQKALEHAGLVVEE